MVVAESKCLNSKPAKPQHSSSTCIQDSTDSSNNNCNDSSSSSSSSSSGSSNSNGNYNSSDNCSNNGSYNSNNSSTNKVIISSTCKVDSCSDGRSRALL